MSEPSPLSGQLKGDAIRDLRDDTASAAPLVERYVAVTLDNVPVAQRDAVEPALRAAIEDEIEHRHDRLLGDEATTRADIEVAVLEEMGDPEQVAAAMTHRPKSLIGPRFYHDFTYILLWSLALAAPIAAALAMLSAAHAGAELWPMVVHGAGVTVTVAVYVSTWITLCFAVSERVARHRADVAAAEWTVDHLPAATRTVISVRQTAVVVVAALAAATALVVQYKSPSLYTEQGDPVTFLNPAHWPWVFGGLVLLLGLDVLASIARHVRGYWTIRASVVNLVLLTGTYGVLAWLLLSHTFVNDAFFDQVGWPTEELPPSDLEDWGAIVVGVLWVIGVSAGFVRAWRARIR